MFGNTMLIFPFGLLPILFIVGWVLFSSAEDELQKSVGSKIRAGITEYPLEVSMALYGTNENKISFSEDGKSVILIVESPRYINLDTPANVREYLKESMPHSESVNMDWVNQYAITAISENKEARTHQIVVSIPDEIVLTDKYIEHEITNVGRVFKRNDAGNSIRWLLYTQGERRVERKDGRLFVYIDRLQIAPGILDEKQKIMSEKQITRSIKNRLWNRVDVRCISLDERVYCGEILGV
ncbi:hypothetical protein QWY74_01710 [Halomonas almeriensis]|uniref:hypothetical protein n=1 Tax=Halomonas almeriensis TaxID=308163 RepID=UPI0025B3801E|nr:hypothetical protein [Halomonas almeriensis]MDN3552194.1 hypothetical protein [Halomonas almeriensis]